MSLYGALENTPYQKFTDDEINFNLKYRNNFKCYKCDDIEDIKNAYRLIREILWKCPKGNSVIAEYLHYCEGQISNILLEKGINCIHKVNDTCLLEKEFLSLNINTGHEFTTNCCRCNLYAFE